jgi:hypothetical protein
MRGSIELTILGLGLLGADLVAQEKAVATLPKIPSYGLEISAEEPVAAQLPNQVYEPGFGCASDGSAAVNVLLPPDKVKPRNVWTFYTVSPSGKTVSFDFKKINDLALRDGQGALAHDIGDRDVDFLFSAQPARNPLDGQAQDRQAAPPGWYVARFDRDGVYHGASELNLPRLVPQKMAAFDDGDLLIFALDEMNRQPQLIRYSMTDQKVHYYFADADFAKKNPDVPAFAVKGVNPDKGRVELAQMRSSMQVSQLSHYKDSILLLQRVDGTPLFQTFPDGAVRTIVLPKLKGFKAFLLIPSDDQLYVEYRKPSGDPNGDDQVLILELDANTGEELRRIAPPGDLEVACVHQGVFRVIRHSGEHTFQFFNAGVRAAAK